MRIQVKPTQTKSKIRIIAFSVTMLVIVAAATTASTLSGPARSGASRIATISAATSSASRGWRPGWLAKPPAYIGRYKLVSSTSRGGKQNAHVNGALTLFMQRTYASSPSVPSGIISLHARQYDVVLYLTDLDHKGSARGSVVHGGSFVAPATGRFTLSKLASGRIVGILRQKGLATQTLTFKRFSTNPQP